jgi:hypothetical protein
MRYYLLFTALLFTNCNGGNGGRGGNYHQVSIANIPASELSQKEEESLLYVREEEKLARDVYITLDEKWGNSAPQFGNIVKSEQRHMDAVKSLIERYSLEDPIGEDIHGVFQNEELQNLYTDLVEQGSKSLQDALTVGAIIEDLDIYDIEKEMTEVDNEDILYIYSNLVNGSENHMRAFVGGLGSYSPKYISIERYDEVLSGSNKNGNGNGKWR